MVFVAREGGGLANLCDLELGPHFISQPQVVYFVTREYRLTALQGGAGLETALAHGPENGISSINI